MKFTKIPLILLTALFFSTQLFPQTKTWENYLGCDDTLRTKGLAVSAEGNIFIAANFNLETMFNSTHLVADGDRDGIIGKFDSNGSLLWYKQIKGQGAAFASAVSVDQSGNVFVAGNFWGGITVGYTRLNSMNTQYDIFVAKYDKDGNFQWAKRAGGSNSGTPQIAADNNGGCYLSANCAYNDPSAFSVSGPYLTRYDTDGNSVWIKQIPTGSVASDPSGNLYITGSFTGTQSFGGNTISSSGGSDIFTGKYDKNGSLIWMRKAGGTQADEGTSVSVIQDGSCYVTGSFSQTAAFSGTQITSSGSSDVFLARYDKDGNLLWVKSAGGSDSDAGASVSADVNGNCYVTGNFSKTASFGSVQFTSKGDKDIFIGKYDSNGKLIWARQNGGTYSDDGRTVAALGNNSCISLYAIAKGPDSYDSFSYFGKYSDAILSLLSPSGSEQWRIGTKQNVSWTTNLEKVMIQLSTNGGTTWIDLTPAPVDGSLGSFSLSVPNKPSAICRIRIYSPDAPETFADTSGAFTITNSAVPSIVITSPNGKEKWQTGSVHDITWTAQNTGAELSIEYTKDGGNSWTLVSGNAASLQGSLKWTLPVDTSLQCRIRIKDNSNASVYDISDNLFTVLPTPEILFPSASSDTLRIAAYKEIKWAAPLVKNVDLFYSADKGKNWEKINHYYNELVDASKGTYNWFVPAIATSDSCILKIVDAEDATVYGKTGNLFTIYNPIRITYPKAGDTLQAGNFYDITWKADGIKNIKIEYSVPGPENCYLQDAPQYCDTALIKEDVRFLPYDASLGIYTWIVPDNANPKVRLKILDAQNPLVYNMTGKFVISPMPSPDSLLALFTSTAVKLSWKDKTDYEDGFKIERKEDTGSYTQIATVDMNVTSYTDNTIDPKNVSTYSYRIRAYNSYASSPFAEISLNPTSVKDREAIPQTYALEQNYPNPFNPSTVISFSLPKESKVKLIIYNELGETVGELLNGTKAAGIHEVSFNAAQLASGLYFYSLEAGSADGKDNFRQVKKMLLVK